MKIQFNLTKEQGEAFTNFFNAVNVQDNTEEEFCKTAFIIGLQTMERSIVEQMRQEYEAQASAQEEGSEDPEIVEETSEEETQNETEETTD